MICISEEPSCKASFSYKKNKVALRCESLEISTSWTFVFTGHLSEHLNVFGLYKSSRKICTRIIPFNPGTLIRRYELILSLGG